MNRKNMFAKNVKDVANTMKSKIEKQFLSQTNRDNAERDSVEWFQQSISQMLGGASNKSDVKKIMDDVFRDEQFSHLKGRSRSPLVNIKKEALSNYEKKKLELTKQGRTESNLDFILRQSNISSPFAVDTKREKQLLDVDVERPKGDRRRNSTDNMGVLRLAKSNADIGGMYTYYYDAKTKNKLPYFDTFPLILMVDSAPKGFYGINLHYVPPEIRAIIIKQILENARVETSDSVLYQMNRKFLESISTSYWKPCFKRYLFSHVQTQMYEVPIESWDKAIMLPHHAFVSYQGGKYTSVGNSRVWSDSLRGR